MWAFYLSQFVKLKNVDKQTERLIAIGQAEQCSVTEVDCRFNYDFKSDIFTGKEIPKHVPLYKSSFRPILWKLSLLT